MRGLISRIFGQAAPLTDPLARDLDAAIARRAAVRRSRPPYSEARRFARARPKVDQLRHDIAMQHVQF